MYQAVTRLHLIATTHTRLAALLALASTVALVLLPEGGRGPRLPPRIARAAAGAACFRQPAHNSSIRGAGHLSPAWNRARASRA